MNTPTVSALFIGLGVLCFAPAAQAAVSVVGNGSAELCYQAAERGESPADYLTYCNQALAAGDLSPRDRAATFVNRGVLRLAMNDTDAAESDFNAGLAINPNMGEAYVDRGALLLTKKRYADAIVEINKGLALGTKEAHLAYYDRAIASEALGNLKGAYDDYYKALQIKPDFEKASLELTRFKIVDQPA